MYGFSWYVCVYVHLCIHVCIHGKWVWLRIWVSGSKERPCTTDLSLYFGNLFLKLRNIASDKVGLRFWMIVLSSILHYSTCFWCCLSSSCDPALIVFVHVFVCLIICVFEYLCICVCKTGWGFVCSCYPVGWEFETWVSSSMVRALPTRRRVIPWWPHVRLAGTGRCRRRPLFENLIICQTLPSLRLISLYGVTLSYKAFYYLRYFLSDRGPNIVYPCHC